MNERKETKERFGVIFAIWDGKKIQLEKRMDPKSEYYGFIIIPGGGVEPNEIYQEAMIREVKEERGVKVKGFESLGVVRDVESDGTVNIRHIFLVTALSGRLSNPEKSKNGNEHFGATLNEARVLCKHPVSQRILDLLEARLSR